MALPEAPRSADTTSIGQFLIEEQITNQIDPHLRRFQARGYLSPGLKVSLVEEDVPSMYVQMEFILDREQRKVFVNDRTRKQIKLSGTGYNIVDLLSKSPNKVYSRSEIAGGVWGDSGVTGSISVHISRIRNSFAEAGISPEIIETSTGVGYSLINKQRQHKELQQRIERAKSEIKYIFPYFSFYPERNQIEVDNEIIRLSPTENDILLALSVNVNKVTSFEVLEKYLGKDSASEVKTYIHRLRKKIHRKNGEKTPVIASVKRKGYMLIDLSVMSEMEKNAILSHLYADNKRLRSRIRALK